MSDVGEFQYEGHWSRLCCDVCGDVFDVEGDVSNGEIYECDACGAKGEVSGR